MRISDWSSDVCSSDLQARLMDLRCEHFGQGAAGGFLPTGPAGEVDVGIHREAHARQHQFLGAQLIGIQPHRLTQPQPGFDTAVFAGSAAMIQPALYPLAAAVPHRAVVPDIGTASCRERGWQYVENSVVSISIHKKTTTIQIK